MLSGTAREVDSRNREWSYQRYRPEQSLLYQLVEEYYPRFLDCTWSAHLGPFELDVKRHFSGFGFSGVTA